jgi:hypothetical protein
MESMHFESGMPFRGTFNGYEKDVEKAPKTGRQDRTMSDQRMTKDSKPRGFQRLVAT